MFLDSFLIRAGLAGLGVALAAGPLGCFVVWRRMAYFGDATAHAAILGVALSLAFNASILAGVLICCLAMAMTVAVLSGRGQSADTVLGVLAHTALAAGLVAVSLQPKVRIDLDSYLFGDILAVGRGDLAVIWIGAVLILALLAWRWNALLTTTLNEDLATASGLRPERERMVLVLALAVVVAVSLKVVGVLLISALLLIPAATARRFAATPEHMGVFAGLIGALASLAGMALAYVFDTPAGPTIVCTASAGYACVILLHRPLRRLLTAFR